MGEHEVAMARRLYEGVRDIEGVTVYGDWETFSSDESPLRAGVLSLNVGDISSADVSDMLMQGWGIATRPGAHCAPLMHEALGTREQGVVRFSTSWFTTQEEIDTAIEAVREIAQG